MSEDSDVEELTLKIMDFVQKNGKQVIVKQDDWGGVVDHTYEVDELKFFIRSSIYPIADSSVTFRVHYKGKLVLKAKCELPYAAVATLFKRGEWEKLIPSY